MSLLQNKYAINTAIGSATGAISGGISTYLTDSEADYTDYIRNAGIGAVVGGGIGAGTTKLKTMASKPSLPSSAPIETITNKQPPKDIPANVLDAENKRKLFMDKVKAKATETKIYASIAAKNALSKITDAGAEAKSHVTHKIIDGDFDTFFDTWDGINNAIHNIDWSPVLHIAHSAGSSFSYMDNNISNFKFNFRGLLPKNSKFVAYVRKIKPKKPTAQLAETILTTVGTGVGGKLGSLAGQETKTIGKLTGKAIGLRAASDATATYRAIKQVRQNPEYATYTPVDKLKQIYKQAVHNSNNYRFDTNRKIVDSANTSLNTIGIKTPKTALTEDILPNVPDILDNIFKANYENIADI